LEYERLSRLELTGRILDFGGGSKSNYSEELRFWGDPQQGYVYESANIDPKTDPTYLLHQDGKIPVESEYYDAVISLNTLEHVYGLSDTFDEIRRVLKTGRRLIFIVPFIFRVHGHPDDYMRGTPSFWYKFLITHGFEKIKIEALNWGPFSTALTISGLPGPFKALRRNLALLMDIVYSARQYGQDITSNEQQDSPICSASLGYFVQTLKRC
jgi:SAM-dependent methyltransferase